MKTLVLSATRLTQTRTRTGAGAGPRGRARSTSRPSGHGSDRGSWLRARPARSSPRAYPARRATRRSSANAVVQRADRPLDVRARDHAGDLDRGRRDQLQVDPLARERPEHPRRDARMRAHSGADERHLAEIVVLVDLRSAPSVSCAASIARRVAGTSSFGTENESSARRRARRSGGSCRRSRARPRPPRRSRRPSPAGRGCR